MLKKLQERESETVLYPLDYANAQAKEFDPEFSMGDHMFRDLALSRDLMREFHEKRIGGGTAEKLNVMVLQRSFWPFSARTKDDIDLPTNVTTLILLCVELLNDRLYVDARRSSEVCHFLQEQASRPEARFRSFTRNGPNARAIQGRREGTICQLVSGCRSTFVQRSSRDRVQRP